MNRDKYSEYITLLKENKNLILTGAPGTGKTYLARKIAEAMNAECEFVQFHPSYDYTDFVEGLRPTASDRNGNIGFERKDGVFKEFCKRAMAFSNNQVVSHKNIRLAKSFDEAYKLLISAIKQRNVTLYTNFGGGTELKVKIEEGLDNGKEIIRYLKSGRYERANINYLQKIYNCYVLKKQYDIKQEKEKQLESIIEGTVINYTCYRGIVQGLLDFTDQTSNDKNSNESSRIEVENTKTKNTFDTFIFIIDEINRGEISKIFGELFFSIDPGYRGKKGKVKTQYQNLITDPNDPFKDGFYVPDNVYIIGTMNDIDRSVESMDFAMRRRFAWKEIKANENTSMLDDLGELKAEVVEKMNRLNSAIWNEETHEGMDGLNAAYHIGGAYFRKLKHYLNEDFSNKEEAYRQLWNNHLHGLLFEYLRGSAGAAENMKLLEKVYFGGTTND